MQGRRFFSAMVLLGTVSIVSANAVAQAAPRSFTINDEKNRDVVNFTSDAPIELIQGRTSKVSGKITVDDSMDLTKPVTGNFDVDLASIDTGIDLRNEHMRDNFLETKKFPKASFVLKSLVKPPAKLVPGTKVTLQALGDFSCHGKTVSKTIPVDVLYMTKCAATESKRPGCDLMQLKATFPVAFKDHDIKRPEIVFQKLADTVIVTISATAYNQVAGGAAAGKTGASASNKPAANAASKTSTSSKTSK